VRKGKSLELSGEDLLRLASYAHWIPMTRGLYKPYLERNFPGWEWNQIIPLLIKKKILVIYSKDPRDRALCHGLYIARKITGVRICIQDEKTEIEVRRIKINPLNQQ
jgi:hypothetical protein